MSLDLEADAESRRSSNPGDLYWWCIIPARLEKTSKLLQAILAFIASILPNDALQQTLTMKASVPALQFSTAPISKG